MSGRGFSIGLRAALAIFTVTLCVTTTWAQAPWERVLYSFNYGANGWDPEGSLVLDARGNLYGTTNFGGLPNCACGTVFQLSHKVGGGWMETVLHSFNNADGAYPSAGLIFDAAGHLYGTTQNGGAYGLGTVFQLRQQGVRIWTEKVLHSFSGPDGINPNGPLIFDAAGNLYGTSRLGGVGPCTNGCGTVFELSPETDGGWTEKVLHSFSGTDGAFPLGSLISDAAGNLYGTTEGGGETTSSSSGCANPGGPNGCGVVFELSAEAGREWTEKVLYTPNDADFAIPGASLILDTAGNLYGTTSNSGSFWGTVFELSPEAGGGWTETVLHSFNDYVNLYGGLIFDAAGNLYGTTLGTFNSLGTVFELSPQADGTWTETVLHSFDPNCHHDGVDPTSGLIMDTRGNLYGTTVRGGAYPGVEGDGYGTVYEIVR